MPRRDVERDESAERVPDDPPRRVSEGAGDLDDGIRHVLDAARTAEPAALAPAGQIERDHIGERRARRRDRMPRSAASRSSTIRPPRAAGSSPVRRPRVPACTTTSPTEVGTTSRRSPSAAPSVRSGSGCGSGFTMVVRRPTPDRFPLPRPSVAATGRTQGGGIAERSAARSAAARAPTTLEG